MLSHEHASVPFSPSSTKFPLLYTSTARQATCSAQLHLTFIAFHRTQPQAGMINDPAVISFFTVAGVIVLGAAIMGWWNNRKSRIAGRKTAEIDTGVESVEDGVRRGGKNVDMDERDDGSIRGWRWKRILCRVGWIKIPSGAECDEEMRDMGRRGAVVNGTPSAQALVSASVADVESAITSRPAVSRLPRPTDMRPFENMGGYRCGGDIFTYGHDNVAPLPVPTTASSPTPYHFSQGIVEVEAPSTPLGAYSTADSRNNSMRSFGSSDYGFSLTSYNGFPVTRQEDRMAALPIPKDHPLHQHCPDSSLPAKVAVRGRSRAVVKHERESLVPAPLNPRRGRHSPHSNQSHSRDPSQSSGPDAQQSGVVELETSSAAQTRRASASRSASVATSESRYSHFENPLGQHPPNSISRAHDPNDLPRRSSVPVPETAINRNVRADDINAG